VAVEDPCYPPILDLVAAIGASPLPVAVDDEGPRPDALEAALSRRPSAFVVVPRAQNPTGAAMTHRRAAALRTLLQQHDHVAIIEDDHAHEIADAPFQTLTSRRSGNWAVIRSVSKSLNPDLRLAVIVGDEVTISRVRGRQALGTGWVSTILQRIVAALWSDPSTHEVIARARDAYAERRNALIAALNERHIQAHGRTGLNVWVPVRDEASTVEALRVSGWSVHAGERFRLRSSSGIRITISTLQPDEAPALAEAIAATQRTAATQTRSY
jgi:DNA-binding transcriptional MocR family regulator